MIIDRFYTSCYISMYRNSEVVCIFFTIISRYNLLMIIFCNLNQRLIDDCWCSFNINIIRYYQRIRYIQITWSIIYWCRSYRYSQLASIWCHKWIGIIDIVVTYCNGLTWRLMNSDIKLLIGCWFCCNINRLSNRINHIKANCTRFTNIRFSWLITMITNNLDIISTTIQYISQFFSFSSQCSTTYATCSKCNGFVLWSCKTYNIFVWLSFHSSNFCIRSDNKCRFNWSACTISQFRNNFNLHLAIDSSCKFCCIIMTIMISMNRLIRCLNNLNFIFSYSCWCCSNHKDSTRQ